MHHLLAYGVNAGVNDANVDMVLVPDGTFTGRGGAGAADHAIATTRFDLRGATHLAASATRLRFNINNLNQYGRHHIFPVNRSATVPSRPMVSDYRDLPYELPINTEWALEESNNLGAANERTFSLLWLTRPGWSRAWPSYKQRVTVRFTSTITVAANLWSGFVPITFDDGLFGGSYAVVGVQVQLASTIAFRLNFPRAKVYDNYKLFPGDLATEAIGNELPRWGMGAWGEWGRFHTFEPPTIQTLSLAAGGTAVNGRLDLIFLGEEQALAYQ